MARNNYCFDQSLPSAQCSKLPLFNFASYLLDSAAFQPVDPHGNHSLYQCAGKRYTGMVLAAAGSLWLDVREPLWCEQNKVIQIDLSKYQSGSVFGGWG